MPGLLGKKIGMTSVFSAEGKNLPCTVIEVGPCVVTQIKTLEKDGYEAVQLGFEDKKEKHTTQPEMGHFKKAGVTPKRYLAEFKNFETAYNLGDVITVDYLENAGFVDVVGTSKGKGFQGVVKRHGFGVLLLSVFGYQYMRQGFFPDMVYDQRYREYKLPEGNNYTRVCRYV